jgi:hypothetical protein
MSEAAQWLSSCGGLLWDVAWKATLLLAAAWVVDRLWLRRRPLTADVMWTAALLGLLALPVGAAALPRVTLPIWRADSAEIESLTEQHHNTDASIVMERDRRIASNVDGGSLIESTSQPRVEPIDVGSVEQVSWPSRIASAAAVYLVVCGLLLCRLSWGYLTPNSIDTAEPWLGNFELRTALFQNKIFAIGSRNAEDDIGYAAAQFGRFNRCSRRDATRSSQVFFGVVCVYSHFGICGRLRSAIDSGFVG